MSTVLGSELNTNHVGIRRSSCILSVTISGVEYLTCRVYASTVLFILLLLGFECFRSVNNVQCFIRISDTDKTDNLACEIIYDNFT